MVRLQRSMTREAARPRRAHEAAEMRVQLRCATGQVERGHCRTGVDEIDHRIDGRRRHLLRALRPGIDMAVHATLVAAVTEVHLQGFDPAATDAGEVRRCEQRKGGVHRALLAQAFGRFLGLVGRMGQTLHRPARILVIHAALLSSAVEKQVLDQCAHAKHPH